MKIKISACDISFELDHSVEVRGEDGLTEVKTVWFSQPNRKNAPIFQNLVAKFTRSIQDHVKEMFEGIDEEEIKKLQDQSEQPKSMENSIEEITEESISQSILGHLEMLNELNFDFEEGLKLFDRVLLSGGPRSSVCTIGGVKLTESILDKIDYQDYLKMFVVYYTFFAKPVKSGIKKESEMQLDSATQVTEL